MEDKHQYKLSQLQKREIAQNLIDILDKDACITKQTESFIRNWILTGPEGKSKAFFDVWDIVLKNFLPSSRPILFRACHRIGKNGKIASFTGRLESAEMFSKGKGLLIICDTKRALEFDTINHKAGKYKHTFYPLVEVLIRAKNAGDWGFSDRLLDEYTGEDEYIMRIDTNNHMHCLKWYQNKN